MAGIKPVNGISADTYKRLALDGGAVYLNYGEAGQELLGATRGGNSFTEETTYREMPADGAPGMVKGSVRRTRTELKLTVNMLEITTTGIKIQMPGSVSAVDSATHDKITRSAQISASDYIDNVALVLDKNDTSDAIVIKLNNVLSLNSLEISGTDEDEAVIPMEFNATYDPANLDLDPFEIFNPLEGGIVRHTLTYTAGANGQIIGDGLQTVADTANGEPVYAAANAGFVFVDWDDLSTDNPRTDAAVSADVTVVANFTSV
jgi:hypothetical protein